MSENLVSGLISGLVVTLFVVVFRAIWHSIIVPWFEERVYKDVRIEGKWFGLYPTSVDLRQDVIVLKRHGHAITGTLTCVKGSDEGDEYSLSGSFRNLVLPLIYESTDREKTDRGTITLRAINNGERLSGRIAFYHTIKDSIDSGNILWFRKREELEAVAGRIKQKKEELEKLEEERSRIEKEERKIETEEDIYEGEAVDVQDSANKSMQQTAEAAAD
ncbi:hypothetical protein [Neptunomonas sp. XY-337]|uniref:hypothetical protein n=1 Tax=Neptunomonas sp. XY-337 TaxID=2561897 RepID=UPI0010A9CAAD|nr:hypothetical protein [Neptunomonas sp. XY-337]